MCLTKHLVDIGAQHAASNAIPLCALNSLFDTRWAVRSSTPTLTCHALQQTPCIHTMSYMGRTCSSAANGESAAGHHTRHQLNAFRVGVNLTCLSSVHRLNK